MQEKPKEKETRIKIIFEPAGKIISVVDDEDSDVDDCY